MRTSYTLTGGMYPRCEGHGSVTDIDPTQPIRDDSETELHDFLHREPAKVRINNLNLTYEG